MAETPIYGRALVAVSAEETDADLIAYAKQVLTPQTASEIHFVHASPGGQAAPDLKEPLRSFGVAEGGDPRPFFHVVEGPREDALLRFSMERECGLILLGHRASRSGRRSLARRLAMKAPCSVWMAPQGAPPGVHRILVPVDYSQHSGDVLREATALAAAWGIEQIHALHVYFDQATGPYDPEFESLRLVEEENAFWTFAARIELHGVDAVTHFEQSAHVSQTICKVAHEQQIDLIVMGTRGRSRSASVLLGSETEETIIHSRIPVLAVKHFGQRLSFLQALLDKRLREREGPRFT